MGKASGRSSRIITHANSTILSTLMIGVTEMVSTLWKAPSYMSMTKEIAGLGQQEAPLI